MTKSVPPLPAYGRLAATVTVSDMDRALAFYIDVLGFAKSFENGDPVGFVILQRNAAELHVSRNTTHRATTQNVAHLLVADADGLYERLWAVGVRIIKGIRDTDFGLRAFVFADPDGNRIDVGQAITVPPTLTSNR